MVSRTVGRVIGDSSRDDSKVNLTAWYFVRLPEDSHGIFQNMMKFTTFGKVKIGPFAKSVLNGNHLTRASDFLNTSST